MSLPFAVTSDPKLRARLDTLLHDTLAALEVHVERVQEGAYLVTLFGENKPSTVVWLIVGERSLQVESFFLRHPDERAGAVYNLVLARNVRSYGVHFATDSLGDVYLVGQVPFVAVDADEIDRILGQVLTHVEEAFQACVETGFGTLLGRERTALAKLRADGAGRRIEGAGAGAPRRDARR